MRLRKIFKLAHLWQIIIKECHVQSACDVCFSFVKTFTLNSQKYRLSVRENVALSRFYVNSSGYFTARICQCKSQQRARASSSGAIAQRDKTRLFARLGFADRVVGPGNSRLDNGIINELSRWLSLHIAIAVRLRRESPDGRQLGSGSKARCAIVESDVITSDDNGNGIQKIVQG